MCIRTSYFFFFNDTATTEIYTLSLHDALPIYPVWVETASEHFTARHSELDADGAALVLDMPERTRERLRSEEHTSELQSRQYLVCRLLLVKKKNNLLTTYHLHTIYLHITLVSI